MKMLLKDTVRNLRRHILAITFISLSCLVSSGATAQTPNWPGWLGPEHNAWVDYFQPPATWPETLTLRWRTDVGTGYGSPIVSDGRIFQHARVGENEVVWCLDPKNGETIWKQEFTVPFQMGGGGERHGKGPKSSAVYSERRLFTMSITGTLSAWDAESGKLLWRHDEDQAFGKSHPYWGAATSPIVDGNLVIVHFGTDERGALVALDVVSGAERWRHGPDGPSYSSPIRFGSQSTRQIVEWHHRALIGVNPADGKLLWEYPFPHVGTDQNMPTPAVHNDMILLGGENRGIHGLALLQKGDAWSVESRWHQTDVSLDMSTAVMNNDLLYGFSHYDSGRLFCLEPRSGEILWQGPPRGGQNAMFLSVPGFVLALMDHGELKILAARGRDTEIVKNYRVAENDTWAPPVLLPNGILIKGLNQLSYWSF